MKWTAGVIVGTLGIVVLAAWFSDGPRGLASVVAGMVFALAVIFALSLARAADDDAMKP